MAKVQMMITVDYEVAEAARRSGVNMSEICEQALASFVGTKKRILSSLLESAENAELRNYIIERMQGSPRVAEHCARRVREELGYHATLSEIKKWFVEQTEKEVDKHG